ncbi:MAG: L-seryl-tRNA(Sec) selenium transferase [Planctomycetota bacterium]|nr:MAG: L-seryl-tRNA(Sec) selenium transferase [Planctomycetota bacterium]
MLRYGTWRCDLYRYASGSGGRAESAAIPAARRPVRSDHRGFGDAEKPGCTGVNCIVGIDDVLRRLPKVDQLLAQRDVSDLINQFGRGPVLDWAREAIQRCRRQIQGGELPDEVDGPRLLERVVASLRQLADGEHVQRLQTVINATGVILHTNLGRAPLAAAAVERLTQTSGYTNLEVDLSTGRRGRRGARVRRLLARLTGAEDALVVNNCASATLLTLQAVAAGREVILARGQLVEIGGRFRLPDVFRASGAMLCEVGTTNRTYLEDYRQAMGEQTAAILRVHRSNFSLTGFVSEPTLQELSRELPRPAGVALIDDLGSGLVHSLESLGIDEPVVQDSVRQGADLVLFSGDKLFGGPQAGIVVGRRAWIDRLASHPLMRAVRCDKLTLAALEATTELHVRGDLTAIPVYRMLMQTESQLEDRARRLTAAITRLADGQGGPVPPMQIAVSQSQIGGGSAPGHVLPSRAVTIAAAHLDALATALRLGQPAVLARCHGDRLWLDMRTVDDAEVETLAQRVVSAGAGRHLQGDRGDG